jgi:hypothetical protein
MQLLLDNRIDLTSRCIDIGRESAVFDNYNFMIRERTFLISDNDGLYSPFNDNGVLANNFRNREIILYGDSGETIYTGLIIDINLREFEINKILEIKTTDKIGACFPYKINAVDKETYAGFLTNGAHKAKSSIVAVDTGTKNIPVNSIISFTESYIPSYRVVNSSGTGTATKTIELDRPLEEDVPDNTEVTVSNPKTTTPAHAVYDALYTAFQVVGIESRIDAASFNAVSYLQSGYEIRYFIRPENNMTLGEWLGILCELGEMTVRENDIGNIECTFGWQWDGSDPGVRITEKEIILDSLEIDYHKDRLLYAVASVYTDGASVNIFQKAISNSDPALAQWLPTDVWKPIPVASSSISDYLYLYASYAAAVFYSERKLNYNKYGRERVTCQLKPYFSGTLTRIPLRQFDNYLLTFNDKADEPYKLISFERNENSIISAAVFERINYPSPGLAK